jgi:hypothetical protein
MDPDGWLLHESEVVVITGIDQPLPETAPARLLAVAPNPFNPRCLISWECAVRSQDVLNVYDLRGRLVTSRTYGPQAAGRRDFRWDGRDRSGQACASGVYLYDITCRAATGDDRPAASAKTWRLRGKMTLSR